ncbi:MAG: flavodoxin domain-containing protein [Saccharofermentanales bacterium]
MNKVLIAYVTKTGTTKNAADEIAAVLQENGFETDVVPFAEVMKIEDYDAVIIGAPINGMNWHPDASAFVAKHQIELNRVPTSYYFMSYILFQGCGFWKKAINKSLDKVSLIVKPVKVGKFGGKLGKEFPAFARILFGVKKDSPIDLTDNTAVRKWADEWVTLIK